MTEYSGVYPGGTMGRGNIVTIKNLIRLLSGLCLIFFFAPMFKITVGGMYSQSISGWNGLTGVTASDVEILSGNPVYLLPMLLPVAIFAVTFFGRQLTDKIVLIIISVCSGVDILFWIILFFNCYGKVKDLSNTTSLFGNSFGGYLDDYIQVKLSMTFWYVMTLLFLIAILTLSIFCIMGMLRLDGLLVPGRSAGPAGYDGYGSYPGYDSYSGRGGAGPFEGHGPAGGGAPRVRFCSGCGARIDHNGKFCGRCGKKL